MCGTSRTSEVYFLPVMNITFECTTSAAATKNWTICRDLKTIKILEDETTLRDIKQPNLELSFNWSGIAAHILHAYFRSLPLSVLFRLSSRYIFFNKQIACPRKHNGLRHALFVKNRLPCIQTAARQHSVINILNDGSPESDSFVIS